MSNSSLEQDKVRLDRINSGKVGIFDDNGESLIIGRDIKAELIGGDIHIIRLDDESIVFAINANAEVH